MWRKVVAAVALLTGLLFTCADAAAQQIVELHVILRDGKVVEPAARRVVVVQGTRVRIRWRSDRAGEVHVHGYDILVKLETDTEAVSEFDARATGRYPVTSHGFEGGHDHDHHRALMHIEVHPG